MKWFRYSILGLMIFGLITAGMAFGRSYPANRGGGTAHSGGGFRAFRGGSVSSFHGGSFRSGGYRGGSIQSFRGGSYRPYARAPISNFRGGTYRAYASPPVSSFQGNTYRMYRGGNYAYGGYRGYRSPTAALRDGGMNTYAYRSGGYRGYRSPTAALRDGGTGIAANRDGGTGTYPYRGRLYGRGAIGGYRYGSVPTRQGINQFLGVPNSGRIFAGPNYAHPGAGVNPYGRYYAGRGGYGYSHGFHRVSPGFYHDQAWAIRNHFWGNHLFTPYWYGAHPYAWHTHHWWRGGYPYYAWAALGWPVVSGWFGYNSEPPIYYDYGNTIVYSGGYVSSDLGGVQTSVPADEYYQEADNLAQQGQNYVPPPQQEDTNQWMPLGVFGLAPQGQTDASLVVQLAVNKDGIVRGNQYDKTTDTTLSIHGSVNKQTQRVAWSVGDDQTTVYDTGLYNLTQDQAPVLIHFGPDRTEQWLMVRMKQPPTTEQPSEGSDTTDSQ